MHQTAKLFLTFLRKQGYVLAKQDAFGNLYVPEYDGPTLVQQFTESVESGETN